jgi:uncharacterized tellurite resistance protein B-like protein
MEHAEHPARALREPDRIAYLAALAQLVSADGVVDRTEMARLAALCDALALSTEGRAALVDLAAEPDPGRMHQILVWVRKDVALRYSLMADAIVIAFADGKLTSAEAAEVAEVARELEIEPAQAVLMARYVESILRAPSEKTDPGTRLLSDELDAALAAHGTHGPKKPSRGWIRGLLARLRGD